MAIPNEIYTQLEEVHIIFKNRKRKTLIISDISEYYCTDKMFVTRTPNGESKYFSLDEISSVHTFLQDRLENESIADRLTRDLLR